MCPTLIFRPYSNTVIKHVAEKNLLEAHAMSAHPVLWLSIPFSVVRRFSVFWRAFFSYFLEGMFLYYRCVCIYTNMYQQRSEAANPPPRQEQCSKEQVLEAVRKLWEATGRPQEALFWDPCRKQNVWFPVFYNKNGNLCYHGTGSEGSAREAIRKQQ